MNEENMLEKLNLIEEIISLKELPYADSLFIDGYTLSEYMNILIDEVEEYIEQRSSVQH